MDFFFLPALFVMILLSAIPFVLLALCIKKELAGITVIYCFTNPFVIISMLLLLITTGHPFKSEQLTLIIGSIEKMLFLVEI